MHLPLWKSSRNFVIEVGLVTQPRDSTNQTQGRASRLSSQFHQTQQDSTYLSTFSSSWFECLYF